MTRNHRRLLRQFGVLERKFPVLRRPIHLLLHPRMRLLRPVFSIVLVLGGVFSFLPVLGIWMLPLGVLLLAIDLPMIQRPAAGMFIRGRRRVEGWFRKLTRS